MNIQISGRLFAAAILILTISALPVLAQTRVVNMIPQNRSGETNQDSEPTLSIDPNNYSRMAGSAFTWDNLNQSPMTTATAPIYVSSDQGATWTLALIVPSQIGSVFPTGDINLFFGSTLSGAPLHETSWLYTGILRAGGFPMTVLRTQDYLDVGTVMTVLDTRTGQVDQPHVAALSDSGGLDKLYVGFNNGYGCVAPGGRSSTLDVSQSAAVAAPTFTLDVIQKRNTACQDGFAQVPAAHPDGTVYAAFIDDWNGSPRIVVVRDDAWGGGATPFTVLTDPSDSAPGRFVTPVLTLQSGAMGNTRLGASNLSIAVDPRNSDRVYVTYGDSNGANSETIHVRRSIDRGQNWSGDLLTVTNAMNPEIAINADGTVGVLYQRVVSNRWEAHLTQTTDPDATVFDNPGLLLANTDATTPSATFQPYIGDYASLRAAGRDFVGIFSASNYPDTANFPLGITFQRYVDWGTHTLYVDAAHTTPVPPSIDPYFFEVDTGLYVKDRPEDSGAEPNPSTLPMWQSEDIWLRKTQDATHAFAHITEDAEYRTGTSNPNYVYVDVRNRGAAPSAGTEQLTLYWAKASSGLSWPNPWTGAVYFDPGPNTMLMGDVIGTVTLPVIAAGSEDIVEFPWSPPDPGVYAAAFGPDQNHFCLLARVTTSSTAPFGMTSPETSDLYGNVQKNNHIAWKNIEVYDLLPGTGAPAYAVIANLGKEKMNVKLKFTAVNADGKPALLDRGTLKVTAGEKLKTIFRQNQPSGADFKDNGDGTFQIVKEGGFLQNIPLEPNQYGTLQIAYVPNQSDEKSKGYAITLTQLEQTTATERIVGGQTFVFGVVKGFGTGAGGTAIAWHCPWWCWLLLLGIILLVLLLFWLRKK